MGVLEVLTIIYVVAKLNGVIDWSWWFVLLPEIVAVGIYIGICIHIAYTECRTNREFKKLRKW